jgi:Na+/melibiose symporter-like transporter
MNQIEENKASGLSIAALITGILFMGIIPIILGAIDLNRIKNNQSSSKGRGMDIAGIVLGAIGILAWIILAITIPILILNPF